MKIIYPLFILLMFLCTACNTGSKATIKNILITQRNIMPADSIIQKQKKGIDLFAEGNVPAPWSIEIDFDKMISFRSTDGTNFRVLPSFDKKVISAETETYRLITDLGVITIRVFNEACIGDGGAGQISKKVELLLANKLYTGCGKYLFDHRLNDSWVLESINNINQVAANFKKGLPELEFNLQSNRLTGSNGCNKFNSAFEVKGNRIKFSPFAGNTMSCKNDQVVKIYSEMLSDQLVDYYLENGKLVLYLGDDSKLFFKRKEF